MDATFGCYLMERKNIPRDKIQGTKPTVSFDHRTTSLMCDPVWRMLNKDSNLAYNPLANNGCNPKLSSLVKWSFSSSIEYVKNTYLKYVFFWNSFHIEEPVLYFLFLIPWMKKCHARTRVSFDFIGLLCDCKWGYSYYFACFSIS